MLQTFKEDHRNTDVRGGTGAHHHDSDEEEEEEGGHGQQRVGCQQQ